MLGSNGTNDKFIGVASTKGIISPKYGCLQTQRNTVYARLAPERVRLVDSRHALLSPPEAEVRLLTHLVFPSRLTRCHPVYRLPLSKLIHVSSSFRFSDSTNPVILGRSKVIHNFARRRVLKRNNPMHLRVEIIME